MSLSLSELKDRAIRFAQKWQSAADAQVLAARAEFPTKSSHCPC
jgi:hypothetical protein